MTQALIKLNENINRVLNIVKAKYDLKDKSETIEFIVKKYIEYENEPELKPEFIEKIKKIKKEKSIRVDDFAKRYGLDV
jgi:metal-responsive CopG/Arc/MetJ family transcriptional regulator